MANKFRENKTEELEELEELLEQEVPKVTAKPSKPGKKGVLAKGLSKIFGGSFLSDDRATQHGGDSYLRRLFRQLALL